MKIYKSGSYQLLDAEDQRDMSVRVYQHLSASAHEIATLLQLGQDTTDAQARLAVLWQEEKSLAIK